LWKEFFNVAKSGDHPENHLAKFGHVSHKKVFFLFFSLEKIIKAGSLYILSKSAGTYLFF